MQKISLLLYYALVQHLPSTKFPLGNLFLKLRLLCLRNFVQIGENCKIQSGVYVGLGKGISIGHNCHINERVRLDNVQLGNYIMVAREVVFLGKMHEYNSIGIPMVQQGNIDVPASQVADDVWIGLRAIIMPGVKIAQGTIIGAGAVVTRDTVEYGIYAGVPAKLIRTRKQRI